MSPEPSKSQKHSYGGRSCMACGGICKLDYSHLRDQVEKKMGGQEVESGMMQPLGRMAEGGRVGKQRPDMEKGVHQPTYSGGSYAGNLTKDAAKGNTSISKENLHGWAKEAHKKKLAELRSMPKPHGEYAQGGMAMMASGGFPDIINTQSPQTNAENAKGLAIKKADGGEIEDMGDDEMMMDTATDECMEALKSGDKRAFKDALLALMHECLEKMKERE